jgi:hypothetical protein
MDILILIIILLLVFGGGGGWYGYNRWYGPNRPATFNPMAIVWIILVIILIIWLVRELGYVRIR